MARLVNVLARAQKNLKGAPIIANWPPVFICKESDKHWEEGDGLSLVDVKAVQYTRKGTAVAAKEQLARIQKVPKCEFMHSCAEGSISTR